MGQFGNKVDNKIWTAFFKAICVKKLKNDRFPKKQTKKQLLSLKDRVSVIFEQTVDTHPEQY